MEVHRKECLGHLEMIQCEYHNINVGFEVMQDGLYKDQEKYENEQVDIYSNIQKPGAANIIATLHIVYIMKQHIKITGSPGKNGT